MARTGVARVLRGQQADRACSLHDDDNAGLRGDPTDGVKRDGCRLDQRRLDVTDLIRYWDHPPRRNVHPAPERAMVRSIGVDAVGFSEHRVALACVPRDALGASATRGSDPAHDPLPYLQVETSSPMTLTLPVHSWPKTAGGSM